MVRGHECVSRHHLHCHCLISIVLHIAPAKSLASALISMEGPGGSLDHEMDA